MVFLVFRKSLYFLHTIQEGKMNESTFKEIMSFKNPPRELREFLQKNKILVHGGKHVTRGQLRRIIARIELGEIKTHPLKTH